MRQISCLRENIDDSESEKREARCDARGAMRLRREARGGELGRARDERPGRDAGKATRGERREAAIIS